MWQAILYRNGNLLQPLFDMIKHVHRYSIDNGNLPIIIFEYEDHIEILQMEGDSFEVDQLDVLQCDHKRWLWMGKKPEIVIEERTYTNT